MLWNCPCNLKCVQSITGSAGIQATSWSFQISGLGIQQSCNLAATFLKKNTTTLPECSSDFSCTAHHDIGKFPNSHQVMLCTQQQPPPDGRFGWITGEQNTPESAAHPKNATHPKTQGIDGSETLRFRVCCVFRFSFFSSKGGAKHTPEHATHLETQSLGTVNFLRFWVCCVFVCVLRPAKWSWIS